MYHWVFDIRAGILKYMVDWKIICKTTFFQFGGYMVRKIKLYLIFTNGATKIAKTMIG